MSHSNDTNKETRKKYRFLLITVVMLLLIAIVFAVLLTMGVIRFGKGSDGEGSTGADKSSEGGAPGREEASEGGTAADPSAAPTEINTTEEEMGRVKKSIIENMAPATEVPKITVTDEMLEKGILNEGNPSRLMAVMEKAGRGEEITIAYLGGSITAGSSASPQAEKCYANLSTKWWKETFPDTKINYVNAGIGATDSWLGVHRVAEDVLSHNPDLVIIEYSVNDYQGTNKETYDSLLRKVLEYKLPSGDGASGADPDRSAASESGPAVIALLLGAETYGYAAEHAPIAFRYKVPIISYSALLTGKLVSWKSVGNSDGTHPDNPGHALIAHLLTEYYRRVLSSINEAEDPGYNVPDISESQTKCRYLNAELLTSDKLKADTMDGFEAGSVTGILFNTNGWKTTSAGTISFTLTTREIGIAWLQKSVDPKGTYASYDLYVDGVPAATLPGVADSWGAHLEYKTILMDEVATHTVELRPTADNTGTEFEILAFGIAR